MRNLVIGLAICGLATQASASSEPQPAQEIVAQDSTAGGGTATASKPRSETEKKVCRRIESSYSHRSEKICLTKKEWQQIDDEIGA